MEATDLLKKIISKGGVIGSCGKFYVNDEILASQYIIECSEHLHTGSVRTLWGKQLAEQIASYAEFTKKNMQVKKYPSLENYAVASSSLIK